MRFAVVDANSRAQAGYAGVTASVTGQWLQWEVERARGHTLVDPADADVILLVFAGSIDFVKECRRVLRQYGIAPTAAARGDGGPYVITGGPVDATPRSAMLLADALVVGEGYRTIRDVLRARTIRGARQRLIDSEHAIERSQWDAAGDVDPKRPWLRRESSQLAKPDPWVDWTVPEVRADDQVVRVVGSKGCHLKCSFCATTYRQAYVGRDPASLKRRVAAHANRGDRVQILSNDPLNLPGFADVRGKLDHASLTLMELRDRANLRAVIARKPRIIRVGVEGVSSRLRTAFGKGMSDADLVSHLAAVHRGHVNTHTFWITHAPYESAADWSHWQDVCHALADRIDWGLHRAKLTAFLPAAPAPLHRFLPPLGESDLPTREQIMSWRSSNSDTLRRILVVAGGHTSTLQRGRVAEQYGIRPAQLPVSDATIDMAPTLDDWARLPCEVIEWPIRPEIRHKIGTVYRRRNAA